MQSALDIEIRNWLDRYLRSEISLAEFRRWFVATTWNVEQRETQDVVDLVFDIEIRLMEFSNGDWTEEELKDGLWRVLGTYRLSVMSPVGPEGAAAPVLSLGSDSQTQFADTQFSAASA